MFDRAKRETGSVLVMVAFWVGFVALALLLLAQVVRYGLAVADLQNAADAAAEAAVSDVDVFYFQLTGDIWFLYPDINSRISHYANANSTYLAPAGYPITCHFSHFGHVPARVAVSCSATVSPLLGHGHAFHRDSVAAVRADSYLPMHALSPLP